MSADSGWLPISSAPTNGARFLAVHRSGVQTLVEVVGQKRDYRTGELVDWDCRAVALNCASQVALSDFIAWQPLQAPPVLP